MYGSDRIVAGQRFIDSREVEERISELEDLRDDFGTDNDLQDYVEGEGNNEEEKWDEWDDSDEGLELIALTKLRDQASNSYDWTYGATLIHRNAFVDYCKELLADIGNFPDNMPWYIEHNIDWNGVADDLEVDYFTVDFDGEEYLLR